MLAPAPQGENRTLTRIILVRHGHVEGIDPPRFRGRQDLPLTERGKAEALAVARRIGRKWRPACVYTSPLSRCVQTGAAIADACGIQSRAIEQLNDLHYGNWQMKTYEEMAASEPHLYASWFANPHLVRFPGGESLQDLASRSADALRIALARHPDQTVVMVAHDSVNRALLVQLADIPISSYWILAQDPCCINEIDIVAARIQIRSVNDTSHLDDLEPPSVS
jgi:broad specificity phosphatase PhoE